MNLHETWRRGASGLAFAAALAAGPGAGQAASPTEAEQLFIWELNRARSDPAAWAAELGLGNEIGGDGQPVDLEGVEPRPPLAVNEALIDSARFHAEEMATYDYFDHQSAVTGDWPNRLARDAGYPLAMLVPLIDPPIFAILPDDSNQIESIVGGYGSGASDFSEPVNALVSLIVDEGVPSLGHRSHLLGIGGLNSRFVEVGVGYGFDARSDFRNYWTLHTGLRGDGEGDFVETYFLTGVAYADANDDQLYDVGEGLDGVTIDVDGDSLLTNAAGGWSLAVPDGDLTVTCSGGGFDGAPSVSVTVAGANREVDCISGSDGAFVDFIFVPEPEPWVLQIAACTTLALARRARRSRMPRASSGPATRIATGIRAPLSAIAATRRRSRRAGSRARTLRAARARAGASGALRGTRTPSRPRP